MKRIVLNKEDESRRNIWEIYNGNNIFEIYFDSASDLAKQVDDLKDQKIWV